MGKKKRHGSDVSDTEESGSDTVSERTKQNVLPVFTQKRQKILPGATLKPRKHPPWYSTRILEEERPDLAGNDGRINLERDEAALMDMFIRGKSDLQAGDLIITDDNLDEDDRRFNRYEVQLKYNEGRYTALYLISRQVCANNETVEKNTLFAMKTSIRPYSVNISLRMKRELRILNELKKNKCPYCPIVLDSGRVADLPFIVMNLLDRNLEKLREQTTIFKASTVYYVAHETIAAIAFLHGMRYIHRDVKLTNICAGAGNLMTRIYLIDYGDTVKKGKKIRYGTPDGYTLPYWSLDAHRRAAARERTDVESWFYVLVDLLAPGVLPWAKMNNEQAMEAEKASFWEGERQMPDSPFVFALFDLVRKLDENFDYQLARRILREAMDYHLRGPLVLEWAPTMRIGLAPLTGRRVVDVKMRVDNTDKSAKTIVNETASTPETTMKTMAEEESVRRTKADNVPKQQECIRNGNDGNETQVSIGASVDAERTRDKTPAKPARRRLFRKSGENIDAVVVSDEEIPSKNKSRQKCLAGHIPSMTVNMQQRKKLQRRQAPRQQQQQQQRPAPRQQAHPLQQHRLQQQRLQQQRLQQHRVQQQRQQQQRQQQQRQQQQRQQQQRQQQQRQQQHRRRHRRRSRDEEEDDDD